MKTLLVLLLLTALTACTSIVNIPPQMGDTAFHDPNRKAIRTIMLRSLQAVLADRPISQPFQVILPDGTQAQAYAQMLPELGGFARWSSDGASKGVPIVAISQIRIRGLQAEVDIIRPQFPDNAQPTAQVVTASLKYDFISNWYVTRLREWRGDVQQTSVPGQVVPSPRQ